MSLSDAWDDLDDDWRVAAALVEKEDAERYRLEMAERDSCESVDAEEQRWIGIWKARPGWYDRIHWERDVPDRDDAVTRTPL